MNPKDVIDDSQDVLKSSRETLEQLPHTAPKEMGEAVAPIADKVEEWQRLAIEMLPNLFVAVVLFALAWLVSKPVARLSCALLRRVTRNEQVVSLLRVGVRLLVIGAGLFAALSVLHLDKTVTSLLAGVGVVGIALGFAFQDGAANLISGVVLSARRYPFVNGDVIETKGLTGRVERLDLRATSLRQFTGELVIIPNKEVLQNPIINFSEAGRRRIDMEVGVAYGSDLDEVREATLDALREVRSIDDQQEPDVIFTGFGDSSIDLVARVWVHFGEDHDFFVARSEVVENITRAYRERGIEIPFPIRTLVPGGSEQRWRERLRVVGE